MAARGTGGLVYREGDRSNVRFVEAVLIRRPGVEIMAMAPAEVGLRLISSWPPDLVELELKLPGMDGRTMLAASRDDPRTAKLPAIAIRADGTPGRPTAQLASGLDGYLAEPSDVAEPLAVFNDILGGDG